jgi:hypothetical protein
VLPESSPSPSPIIEPDVRISRIRLSDWQLAKAAGTTRRLTGLRQVTHCRLLQQAHRKSWSFPPPAFPGFRYCDPVRLPCGPTPNSAVEAATVVQHGPPSLTPLSRRAVPNTPVDRPRCICRLLPQIVLPSPNSGRVGVHNLPFEPCSGFTRVTAGRFAPPPMATFIAELRYCRLPDPPPASYRTDRPLPGWDLHPQDARALRGRRTRPHETGGPMARSSAMTMSEKKPSCWQTAAGCSYPPYRLRSITIGGRTATDVRCAINNSEASSILLGQSFLKNVTSWSINNARNTLVLE